MLKESNSYALQNIEGLYFGNRDQFGNVHVESFPYTVFTFERATEIREHIWFVALEHFEIVDVETQLTRKGF